MLANGPPCTSAGEAVERLHEIGLERVLEQRSHSAGRLEIGGGDRPLVSGPADHHAAELLLELLKAGCEAEGRHNLRGDRNVETVLARKAVARAKPDNGLAKRAVVHIEHAPPGDAPLIETERVAPVHVIVDHRRKQIVRRCDGVKIAGEMEVDLVHRDNLGVAAAGRAALHAEARPERRLAQADDRFPADAVERVAEADGGCRLALARRGRADRRHKNELAVRAVRETAKKIILELGDEAAERAQGGFRARRSSRRSLRSVSAAQRARFRCQTAWTDASPGAAAPRAANVRQRIVCPASFCKRESWRRRSPADISART